MRLKNLKTNFLGKNIVHYEVIDSTQKEIHRRIENGKIENGTVIFADLQTEGIGTHGKKWYTDEENNIAFSFYILTECNLEALEGITLEIAETILEAFESKYNIKLKIKEPNDIYCNGKKLGGILTESKVFTGKVKYLVIGIGINTNKGDFPTEIREIATSIIKEFGISIDTKEFIEEFCNVFESKLIKRLIKS